MRKLKYVRTFEGFFPPLAGNVLGPEEKNLKSKINSGLKGKNWKVTIEGEDSPLIITGKDFRGEERKLEITKSKNLYNISSKYTGYGVVQKQTTNGIKEDVIPDFVVEFMNPDIRISMIGDVVKRMQDTKNSSWFDNLFGL